MRFKVEQVKQLRKNMIFRDSWLKVRKKVSEQKCQECKRLYIDIPCDKLAMLILDGVDNQVICNECADKYIALGIEDIDKKIQEREDKKNNIIASILSYYKGGYIPRIHTKESLEKLSTDDLNLILAEKTKQKEYQDFVDAIDSSKWEIEEYLKTQYNVLVDKIFLKHVDQIEKYFSDSTEYFGCGQGYYEDEVDRIVFIDNKFYKVTLFAEIGSSKQDRGDRLYWAERIEKVEYEEIEKPKEEIPKQYNFILILTLKQKEALDNFIKELK
jgi:hypothetical protein